jgi:hypothetical protein
MKHADFRDVFKKGLQECMYINTIIFPDSVSSAASTSSAVKTPENTEEDHEPADEGDIQMEYSCDQVYSPNIGAVTKNYL